MSERKSRTLEMRKNVTIIIAIIGIGNVHFAIKSILQYEIRFEEMISLSLCVRGFGFSMFYSVYIHSTSCYYLRSVRPFTYKKYTIYHIITVIVSVCVCLFCDYLQKDYSADNH